MGTLDKNPVISEDAEIEESPRLPFPIVGIGASAGGLEAFTALLEHLPQDTGMAFVLIQHLSPSHKSMLTSLLEKKSTLPVTEVTNGMSVSSNHVYVIPPNTCMSISDGKLCLDPRLDSNKQNLPIDFFLNSLGPHQKNKAIAVILSGTASDGSHGIKVIKDHGGITFAQDESAKYDMMPKNAVATGHVDFVLSPQEIVKKLIDLSHHPYINHAETKAEEFVSEEDSFEEDSFSQILILLQKISGINFRNYKPTTLKRRVLRRMMLNKIDTLKEYVSYLIRHAKELQALYQDVFITVTRFFRDPEIFEALKHDVFPYLLKVNRSGESIRIWVLGCSTGEEVYSLAISFHEFLEGKEDHPLQFFATDIVESSIEKARQGIYPASIAHDVSTERLHKFFIKVNNGYQINKSIRDTCVFARQNVMSDPPFSKLDLISCRNLLIYLNPASQKRIIPIFHYALNPAGFLLLGQSESVIAFPELFSVVNKKAKIYSKNQTQKTAQLILTPKSKSSQVPSISKSALPAGLVGMAEIQREADRVILKKQHHCGVVLNESMEVVQFRGDTSRYLMHLPGTASLNLLKMVQDSLFLEMRNAIKKAAESNTSIKTENIRIKNNGVKSEVSLEIIPFKVSPNGERYFLVVFEEVSPSLSPQTQAKRQGAKTTESPSQDPRVGDLEQELESMKLYLQGIIDEKEAANEELQAAHEEVLSANEELQSLNEEFQSTNEELESAKEELQATNEEITTLNDELQNRNSELTRLNDDHANLINSISLPIIMVDRDFRIRSFTPMAEKMFGFNLNDLGRPLGDFKSNIVFSNLEALVLEVMNTNTYKEQEWRDPKGQWYRIQGRPYMTSDNKKDGAVVTFIDITESKKSQDVFKESGDYREAIFQTVRHPLLVLDAVLRVTMANKSFYETFKARPKDTLNSYIFTLGNGEWNNPKLRDLLENILPQKEVICDYKVEWDFPRIGRKVMLLNAKQIMHQDNEKKSILLAIEDITESEKVQDRLQAYAANRDAIIQSIHDPLLVLDPHLKIQFANNAFYQVFHESAEKIINQSLYDLGNGQWNIPSLRVLFEEILPKHHSIDDYAIEHAFPVIGLKTMLFNARGFHSDDRKELILLTIRQG